MIKILFVCHGLFRQILTDPEYAKELQDGRDDWEEEEGDRGLIHDDFPRG